MQDAIEQILKGIPVGNVFDSHYIISQLIKHHSDVYREFASGINAESNKTAIVHGQIAQKIVPFEKNDLIERVEGKSWSENIHGNSNECTTWRKL